MTLRIANAAGFWGDCLTAPRRLVESAEVDFLTLEYLAELTMSILAHQKAKDPSMGFAHDVLHVVRDIAPVLTRQPKLRIVTNAGGINPNACARAVARILVAEGLGDVPIATVSGDDLKNRLRELAAAGCHFVNLDTGERLSDLEVEPVSANAYLGAAPIVEALDRGARIVITGRVADASLTVAPAVHTFGWKWDDWPRLASASVAGHLIECGAQVTGGYSDRWQEIDFVDIGYPIAEIDRNGGVVVTKPDGSGGIVDLRSVSEQLIYEIGDPRAYLTPDVVVDFTSVELTQIGKDRVLVSGARGEAAPAAYKVSIAYPSGYMSSAQLVVWGTKAAEKARFTGKLILDRLARSGIQFAESLVECLGNGDAVPMRSDGTQPAAAAPLNECVLRLSVRDADRGAVERFTREIAPLITNGPAGLAGYAAGRPTVRPVLAYWPALIPKHMVQPEIEMHTAQQWNEAEESS